MTINSLAIRAFHECHNIDAEDEISYVEGFKDAFFETKTLFLTKINNEINKLEQFPNMGERRAAMIRMRDLIEKEVKELYEQQSL